jgi:hypothetical protein
MARQHRPDSGKDAFGRRAADVRALPVTSTRRGWWGGQWLPAERAGSQSRCLRSRHRSRRQGARPLDRAKPVVAAGSLFRLPVMTLLLFAAALSGGQKNAHNGYVRWVNSILIAERAYMLVPGFQRPLA